MALLIEAGQMTASDYVPIYPDLPLASKGTSTDAIPVSTRVPTCRFANEDLKTVPTIVLSACSGHWP